MGILRRISDVTRSTLTDLSQGRRDRSPRALADMTDEELEEELLRRRRARAQRHGRRARGKGLGADPREQYGENAPQRKQLLQYYANLELRPGATLDDVRRAYRELMQRYHPDRHVGDDERYQAAAELAQSLTKAYQALTDYLKKQAKGGSGTP